MFKRVCMHFMSITAAMLCLTIQARLDGGGLCLQAGKTCGMHITWEEPVEIDGETAIEGLIHDGSGALAVVWIINSEGRIRLESADGTPAGKELFPMVREDGTALIFKQFPAPDLREPARIHLAAEMQTSELFAVLPDGSVPPASTVLTEAQPVAWGGPYERNGAQYLPGRTATPHGSLEIIWKMKPGLPPELIYMSTPGAGDRPPVESALLLWTEGDGTNICKEMFPQLNQDYVPYLQCLARVSTAELMSGIGIAE